MSIGNILIRPQMLDRHPLSTGGEIMDLLTTLASRLVEDFLRGGPASEKIAAACSESIAGFIPQFEPRLETVGSKLELWLKPYLDLVKDAPTPDTTVAGLVKTSDFGFNLLKKIIDDVHAEPLTGRLIALVDIVENDLGVTREGMEHLFLDMLDRIVVKLSYDFLNGIQDDEGIALNNFLLSVQIRRIRRDMQQLLDLSPLPDFNPRQMIRDGQLRLEAAGWDAELDKFKGSLAGIQQKITEGVPKLNDLLKFDTTNQGLLARDIGDNAGQYAWYISWFKDEPTALVNRFSLDGVTDAEAIKFEVGFLNQTVLEHWTHWTKLVSELLKAVAAGTHIGLNNFWSPFLNIIGGFANGVFTFSTLKDDKGIADFMKFLEYKVPVISKSMKDLTIIEPLTFAGSFEKYNGFWAWLWAFWQADRKNANEPNEILEWGESINEALLSIFTLINNNPKDEHAENRHKIDGWTSFWRKLSAHFIAHKMAQGERYHALFDNFGRTTVTYLLGGGLGVFGVNVVAWLLAGALSRKLSTKYWTFEDLGDNAYVAFLSSLMDFNGAFDLEGDTEGGKYGLKTVPTANGSIDYQHIELSGYAPQSSSPYLLPFDTEGAFLCSQTHRGRSSHNNHTGLIYAVDFVLKKDDIVLAMRGGTVIEFEDNFTKDDGHWNYIVIQHDTLDAVHDKTEKGHSATTYARYENGQPFGIRRVFASMGIPPDAIIGAKVEQGTPIMLLGERRVSASFSDLFQWKNLLPWNFAGEVAHEIQFGVFDHLQVHVWATAQDGKILPTIPFVFKDIEDKGVPESGKFYKSDNKRKKLANTSLFHAPHTADVVEESGADYVILGRNVELADNYYKNAHIFINYTLSNGETGFEYKKISRYEGDSRKAFIADSWLLGSPPPIGAEYSIGSKPFNESDPLDKAFAFLADRDGAGAAKDLATDRPPFKWI